MDLQRQWQANVPTAAPCLPPTAAAACLADLLPVLGPQSMVLTAGEVWQRQRDAFNPGFSAAFLRAALPGFLACAGRLAGRLDAAAAAGEVVRMHDLAVLTTLEVICEVRWAANMGQQRLPQLGRLEAGNGWPRSHRL